VSADENTKIAAIILAAGRSRRMKSDVPKVLHSVLGIPLVEHVARAALSVGTERIVVVVSPEHREAVRAALADLPQVSLAVQSEPKGTAHAVLAARAALEGFEGMGLVLCGDAPCISQRSLSALVTAHREADAQLSLLTGRVPDPTGYGRIVREDAGRLAEIVEEKDATDEQRAIDEINSGTFALDLPASWEGLEAIGPSAATGELYVTDAVGLTRERGGAVQAVNAAGETDVLGVNDRAQLAQAISVLRERINQGHMKGGVTIVDSASTFIDPRARIEADVRIEPFVMIQGPCVIEAGAVVGPFAHIRGGSKLGPRSRVGNFVEVVRSQVGEDTNALHLSYLGDGTLGAGVNVGAGTIFANWDGTKHHETNVGAGASLGANTVVVAPATLGERCRTGAGSVVVRTEIPAGATYVGVPARGLRSQTPGGDA
jgi:bifunctional UDP-N-acetylglucosamine pyrophosphorylase/glucosamine-1-phosphate N-acetyltransferase